jgi:hypothetical protein
VQYLYINNNAQEDDMNKKTFILTKIATLGSGYTVHEDPNYGDEAPLILMHHGVEVQQDCYEVSDYIDIVNGR